MMLAAMNDPADVTELHPLTGKSIPMIGVVGGIGSGKSAVANWVAAHANVSVIDADKLGHDALKSAIVKEALLQRFGFGIFGADGFINRTALAKQVFGDSPEQLAARQDLERIVHPEIGRRISEEVALATTKGRIAVLLDAAILLEAGWRQLCDLVVFVDTPDVIRLSRVQQNRNWTEDELRRREASQFSLDRKRLEADFVITNDRDLEYAGRQVLELLRAKGIVK
jgi:dephospho-CoA kinase